MSRPSEERRARIGQPHPDAPTCQWCTRPLRAEIVRVVAERDDVTRLIEGHPADVHRVPTMAGVYCSRQCAAAGLTDSVEGPERRREQIRAEIGDAAGPALGSRGGWGAKS